MGILQYNKLIGLRLQYNSTRKILEVGLYANASDGTLCLGWVYHGVIYLGKNSLGVPVPYRAGHLVRKLFSDYHQTRRLTQNIANLTVNGKDFGSDLEKKILDRMRQTTRPRPRHTSYLTYLELNSVNYVFTFSLPTYPQCSHVGLPVLGKTPWEWLKRMHALVLRLISEKVSTQIHERYIVNCAYQCLLHSIGLH